MKVFITGGTGYAGTAILEQLDRRHVDAVCLVRSEEDLSARQTVVGDIMNPASLAGAMDGCEAVIHLVGIIEEKPADGITFARVHGDGTKNVVDAARQSSVKTFVQMSANGARADGVSAYQTGKWRGEEAVRAAGFESATIFRPSLIFGKPAPGQPEFASDLLRKLIRPFPVLPVFGDGQFGMQPVALESVAAAFAAAATEPVPGVRSYCVSGPDVYPYVEIIDIITKASGRSPKPKIHVPVSMVRLGTDLAGWTGLLPISRDQLDMLVEGNTCDHEPFHRDFGLEPIPFDTETLSYLR